MGDPLSVAGAAIGIAVPVFHATRLLLDDVQNIVDAPKAIASLRDDLQSVDTAMKALKVIPAEQLESLGLEVVNESNSAITACDRSCEMFRADLQCWAKNLGGGKLRLRDRVNIGFFKKQRIVSLSGQLQNCKMTLSTAASVANL